MGGAMTRRRRAHCDQVKATGGALLLPSHCSMQRARIFSNSEPEWFDDFYGQRVMVAERVEQTSRINKIVLAFSGGMDTSVILRWLQEEYQTDIITFTADIGQGAEVDPVRSKAQLLGATQIYVEDLRDEFVRDYVFPMFRANTLYEGTYLLGTAIARPIIAKRLVEIARAEGADAIAHGATGKGNDQIRFELGAYALNPEIRVIAPWRDWQFTSRNDLLEYAQSRQIPITKSSTGAPPFSMDGNLLHFSYEGGILEDPEKIYDASMFQMSCDPSQAPDQPLDIVIAFERGDPVAIGGEALGPKELLGRLNQCGGAHGIGQIDIVENRVVGMKSRGVYETPGGTILLHARRAMEGVTLDRGSAHLKDGLMPRYAELIYDGLWFSPEREMLQAAIDHSQRYVAGEVSVRLYRGGVRTLWRRSPYSLYDESTVSFDQVGDYDQKDASGFIRLQALRLRILARRNQR